MSTQYQNDFYAWTQETAALLKAGKLNEVDMMNIADEIEELGMSDERAVASQLSRLIAHLLKWQYFPLHRGKSWEVTIEDARLEIDFFLNRSKRLHRFLAQTFNEEEMIYRRAVAWAAKETGLEKRVFPKICPFTLEQALDDNFLPD